MAQLNDLIVNGCARFLNTIKGTIENSEKVGGHATPTSGNASTDQVVLGNDSRLTDSRNANDVYAWAKASSKPSYSASEITGKVINGAAS